MRLSPTIRISEYFERHRWILIETRETLIFFNDNLGYFDTHEFERVVILFRREECNFNKFTFEDDDWDGYLRGNNNNLLIIII